MMRVPYDCNLLALTIGGPVVDFDYRTDDRPPWREHANRTVQGRAKLAGGLDWVILFLQQGFLC